MRRTVAQSVKHSPRAKVVGLPRRKMAATSEERSVMEASQTNPGQSQPVDPLKMLYPMVNEEETPLPRSWSPKDKYNYIGLSQNNLRVHYKGTFCTHSRSSLGCSVPSCAVSPLRFLELLRREDRGTIPANGTRSLLDTDESLTEL